MNTISYINYHDKMSKILLSTLYSLKKDHNQVIDQIGMPDMIVCDFFEQLVSSYYAMKLLFSYENPKYSINSKSGMTPLQSFFTIQQVNQNIVVLEKEMRDVAVYKKNLLDSIMISWNLPDMQATKPLAKKLLLDYLKNHTVYDTQAISITHLNQKECVISWMSIDVRTSKPTVFCAWCNVNNPLNELQQKDLKQHIIQQKDMQDMTRILYTIDRNFVDITPIKGIFFEITHYYSDVHEPDVNSAYQVLKESDALQCTYGETYVVDQQTCTLDGFSKPYVQIYSKPSENSIHGETVSKTILFAHHQVLQKFYDVYKKEEIILIEN